MIWMILSVILIVIDQLSKQIIEKQIEYGESIEVIKNFFYLTNHKNEGAAWGILQGAHFIFIPLTIIMAGVMIYLIYKRKETLLRLSLSIVLGGAIGNFLDRVFQEGVTDFLDFHFGAYIFPTFNFADMCITCGTILLAYYLLFIYKEGGSKELSVETGKIETDEVKTDEKDS